MKYHQKNKQLILFKIYAYQYLGNRCGYSTARVKNRLLCIMKRKKGPRHTKRKFFGGKVKANYYKIR